MDQNHTKIKQIIHFHKLTLFAFYIQRVFGDDQTILDKLGIKPENVKHIFWEANSRGTDLDYYTIWKKGGLNINGPKPHENKIDYRFPETRCGGFV